MMISFERFKIESKENRKEITDGLEGEVIPILAEDTKESFSFLEEELGELTEKEQKLVTILKWLKLRNLRSLCVVSMDGLRKKERLSPRAFVAKAAYNLPTTTALLDRLAADKKIRRICGWEKKSEIPHESTFPEPLLNLPRVSFRPGA
jgi:hypothetical protein